jgi:hypothetical protein
MEQASSRLRGAALSRVPQLPKIKSNTQARKILLICLSLFLYYYCGYFSG